MTPVFPISLHVHGKTVVLVGRGARVTARRERLSEAGARVVEVAPDAFHLDICRGAFLVMAHSDDAVLDREIASAANAVGCLCYVHDQPNISDFSMPAVAGRGPLRVAISTQGRAPTLAARIREIIQMALDRVGQPLDDLLGELVRERAASPRSGRRVRLAAMATRLVLEGRLRIEP